MPIDFKAMLKLKIILFFNNITPTEKFWCYLPHVASNVVVLLEIRTRMSTLMEEMCSGSTPHLQGRDCLSAVHIKHLVCRTSIGDLQ